MARAKRLISLIAAVSQNGVIGRDGDLPWRLPDDFKFFKRTTKGHAVIMGRRTYDSMDGPLPDRRNIVVTHRPQERPDGAETAGSLAEALKLAADDREVFVIGGEQIFREAMPLADRMYLTRVNADVNGDVRFPEWDPDEWDLVSEDHHPADDRHAHSFDFMRYERRPGTRSETPGASGG